MFISRLQKSRKESVWEGYSAVLKVFLLTNQIPGQSCNQRTQLGNSFVSQNASALKLRAPVPGLAFSNSQAESSFLLSLLF